MTISLRSPLPAFRRLLRSLYYAFTDMLIIVGGSAIMGFLWYLMFAWR